MKTGHSPREGLGKEPHEASAARLGWSPWQAVVMDGAGPGVGATEKPGVVAGGCELQEMLRFSVMSPGLEGSMGIPWKG